MKIVFFLSLALNISVLLAKADPLSEDCPQICPALWAPVCAFNGKCSKTFSNFCVLIADSCAKTNGEKKFEFKHDGECDISKENLCKEKEECNGICTKDLRPICGYNGKCYKTFSNPCIMNFMNCENRQKNLPEFRKISNGNCSPRLQECY
uniref:Kazal-like domain-containing protein n=1 Tax=Megaselia scalaris TaxID=36166 RepID=T1GZE6_MEGSC